MILDAVASNSKIRNFVSYSEVTQLVLFCPKKNERYDPRMWVIDPIITCNLRESRSRHRDLLCSLSEEALVLRVGDPYFF